MRIFCSLVLIFAVAGCHTQSQNTQPQSPQSVQWITNNLHNYLHEMGPPPSDSMEVGESWRGIDIPVQSDKELGVLEKDLPHFAAIGVNVLVIEVNYNFEFQSHSELREGRYITKAKAHEFAEAAKAQGIRVIPEMECLGHQSIGKTTRKLLAKYPQLDETPGKFMDDKGIYCRSWCPENPEVYKIIFPMIDEVADAFEANAFHVGMDEVFIIGDKSCPLCHDQDPAKLFALCVNKLHEHIVGERKMQMLMWGDRLLDARTMGHHMYEESMNGTWPAVDMIPKDIIICDWHYLKQTNYPSVPFLLGKGFRVWPSGFKPLDATLAFSQFSLEQREHDKNVIGYLCTTWSARTNDLAVWPPITQVLPAWKGK